MGARGGHVLKEARHRFNRDVPEAVLYGLMWHDVYDSQLGRGQAKQRLESLALCEDQDLRNQYAQAADAYERGEGTLAVSTGIGTGVMGP